MEDAPKAQEGNWTLVAPDGTEWYGKSPIDVAGKELRERVPATVRVKRVLSAIEKLGCTDEGEEPDHGCEFCSHLAYCVCE